MGLTTNKNKPVYGNLYSELANRQTTWPAKHEFIKRLAKLGEEIDASKAIEFGCGRGQDALALKDATGWFISATDASADMVRTVPRVLDTFILDVSSAVDVPNNYYDIAFCSFLVHLLTTEEKLLFYQKARQTLRAGGIFVILTASEEDLRHRRITRYFPSALEIDRTRYLTIEENGSLLKSAGFPVIQSERIAMGIMKASVELEIFEQRTSSILRLLSHDEFETGMKRLKNDLPEVTSSAGNASGTPWWRTLIISR